MVVGLAATAAQAAPIGPASITNGGLTFSNFDCVSGGTGLAGGSCGGLNVRAFGTAGVELYGGLSAVTASGGTSSSQDVVFTYQVSSGSSSLNGVDLTFNGAVSGPGAAFAEVRESVYADAGRTTLLGDTGVSTAASSFSSLLFTQAVSTAYVVKDILMQTFAPGLTTATISFVDQNFLISGGTTPGGSTPGGSTPGTPVSVPEPASLALFGAGLLGLAAVRRKRSA